MSHHSLCGEPRQDLSGEALDLPELVDGAKRQMKWSTPASAKVVSHSAIWSGVPTGPQLPRSIAWESSG